MVLKKRHLFMVKMRYLDVNEEIWKDVENDDFVGTVKNRFKVIGKCKNITKSEHNIYYKCKCKCGNIFYRNKYEIMKHENGACKSCKRIRPEFDKHTKEPLYRVYYAMKQRCYDVNSNEYHNYGARGINICKEWLDDYNLFKEWCLNNGYRKGLQIDRIDNNKNYCPSNCRFVTPMENSNNKRTCVYIKHNGEVHTINQWSRILGINKNTFWRYIRVKQYSIQYVIDNYL